MVPLALPSLAAAAEPPEHDTLQATIFSGLGALAAGDLSAGAMMQPLMGGSERSLELTLEAFTPGSGPPRAEHRVPAGLGLACAAAGHSRIGFARSRRRPGPALGDPYRYSPLRPAGPRPQPYAAWYQMSPERPTTDGAGSRTLAGHGGRRRQQHRQFARHPLPGGCPHRERQLCHRLHSTSIAATTSWPPLQVQVSGACPAWQLSWQPLAGVQDHLSRPLRGGRRAI
jgi:hypothetical protein